MAGARRTRLKPEQRRAQLLDLGTTMLSTRTIEQVAVDDIAELAGVSKALFFHYFPTKQDFHRELVRMATARMLERTRLPATVRRAPIETLRESLALYLDYVSENRAGYVSFVRGPAGTDPELHRILDETRAEMAERTLALLANLGVAVTPYVRLAARGWVAFVEEIAIQWLVDPRVSRADWLALAERALPTPRPG